MNIQTNGRRKTSIARAAVAPGKGKITINKKTLEDYFPSLIHQFAINKPLVVTGYEGKLNISINIRGGGQTGQSQAARLAIARALVEHDAELKSTLRKEGLLTRDARGVERKKSGQKKARKRFQFSKR